MKLCFTSNLNHTTPYENGRNGTNVFILSINVSLELRKNVLLLCSVCGSERAHKRGVCGVDTLEACTWIWAHVITNKLKTKREGSPFRGTHNWGTPNPNPMGHVLMEPRHEGVHVLLFGPGITQPQPQGQVLGVGAKPTVRVWVQLVCYYWLCVTCAC